MSSSDTDDSDGAPSGIPTNNLEASSELLVAAHQTPTRDHPNLRVKMPQFNGKNWASFKNRFEKAARYYQLSSKDKATAMYTAIEKDAEVALEDLDSLDWTYEQLVAHLDARYGRTRTWADVVPEARHIQRQIGQPLSRYYDQIMQLLNTAKISPAHAKNFGFHIYVNGLRGGRQMLNEVMTKIKETSIQEIHRVCTEYEAIHGLTSYEPHWDPCINMVRAAEDSATQTHLNASVPVHASYQTPIQSAAPNYGPSPQVPQSPAAQPPRQMPAPQQNVAPPATPLPAFVNAFLPAAAPPMQAYAPQQSAAPASQYNMAQGQYQTRTPVQVAPAPLQQSDMNTAAGQLAAENERLQQELNNTKASYNRRLDIFDRRVRQLENRPPPEEDPNRSQAARAANRQPRADGNGYQGQPRQQRQGAGGQRFNAQQQGPPPPAAQYQQNANAFAQAMPHPPDGIYRRGAPQQQQQQQLPPQQPQQQQQLQPQQQQLQPQQLPPQQQPQQQQPQQAVNLVQQVNQANVAQPAAAPAQLQAPVAPAAQAQPTA